MSFNEQHIVNKDNFQELCLLYIDGELTQPQMDALIQFAAAHPELQEEFSALQATKLEAHPLRFEGKESLLSFHMEGAGDESLLLYLDNELPAAEREEVSRRLAENPHYQQSFELLKRATLDPNESLTFRDKETLYRRTETAVRPMFFLRVAVAVMVILAGAIFWLTSRNVGDTAPPIIVQVPGKTTTQPPAERALPQPQEQVVAKDQELAPAVVPGSDTKVAPAQQDRSSLAATPRKRSASPGAPAVKRPAPQPPVEVLTSIAGIDRADRVQRPVNKVNTIDEPSQHTLNNPSVTTVPSPTYTTIDAAAPTDSGVSYAVASNNEKKGSVRGFLRKATRFIERRTGINPVNEDDELLIGVVAIKL